MKMDTRQWEEQANIYNYLVNNPNITKLEVHAMMTDWKPTEAKIKKKQGYPQCPIQVIPLKMWSTEEALLFIQNRITLLEKAKGLSDEELATQIPCSRYDQWSSEKDHALFKKGAKRATKVFPRRKDAEEYFKDNPKFTEDDYEIITRYTKRTRCLDYCNAKKCCVQFKRENTSPIDLLGN